MNQRDRYATGGAVAPRPAEPRAGARASRDPCDSTAASWDNYFRALSPSDKQRVIGLVHDHGLMLKEESAPAITPNPQAFRQLLDRLGSDHDRPLLQPLPVLSSFEPFDSQLDSTQRDAVARALHTPDLLLVQGLP